MFHAVCKFDGDIGRSRIFRERLKAKQVIAFNVNLDVIRDAVLSNYL
jgi:hypothetical protein